MSKMAELAMEIENLYFDEGMGFADIEKRIGLPYADIEAYIKSLDEDTSDYDESMDGDFDSAMASAGFGTDEDYGCSAEDML